MADESKQPRIGVYICDCRRMTKNNIDFRALTEYTKTLPDVTFSKLVHDFCNQDAREKIKRSIKRNKVDRLVVAACSPRLYLDDFRDIAQEAGLNRFMVEMANLREQLAWIHSDKKEATAKAKDLMDMAIARTRLMKPSANGPVAEIDPDQCSGCGICPSTCRLGGITMLDLEGGKKRAVVDPVECKGCGACVAACPSGALNMEGFSNEEMLAQVDAATKGLLESREPFPSIIVFACHWCSYAAGDMAGMKRLQMDPHFRVIRTPCSSRVDPEWVLRALSRGADGVLILGGKEGTCHYEGGNIKTGNRAVILTMLIEQLGYDPGRFKVEWVDPHEARRFVNLVESFLNSIKDLGPNPVRAPSPEEMLTSALYHPEIAPQESSR